MTTCTVFLEDDLMRMLRAMIAILRRDDNVTLTAFITVAREGHDRLPFTTGAQVRERLDVFADALEERGERVAAYYMRPYRDPLTGDSARGLPGYEERGSQHYRVACEIIRLWVGSQIGDVTNAAADSLIIQGEIVYRGQIMVNVEPGRERATVLVTATTSTSGTWIRDPMEVFYGEPRVVYRDAAIFTPDRHIMGRLMTVAVRAVGGDYIPVATVTIEGDAANWCSSRS